MDPEEQDGALSALTSDTMQNYAVPEEAPPADGGSVGGLTLAEYMQREDEDKAERAAELALRKQNFDAYAQALREARAGPSKEQRIIQALYAFGAPVPKQGGNFFTALGNAGRSLQATGKEAADAEAAMKLKMAELGLQESSAVQALNEKYRTASATNRRALALAGAKGQATFPIYNKIEFKRVYGRELPEGVESVQVDKDGKIIQTFTTAPMETVSVDGQTFERPKGARTPYAPAAGLPKPPPKPLPPALEIAEGAHTAAIKSLYDQNDRLKGIYDNLRTGKVNLSLAGNVIATARGAVGVGGKEYADLVSVKATLQKMRDDSLALAKGTQTEGDAQRAWSALFGSLSDEKALMQRLTEIAEINERSAKLHALEVQRTRSNYGLPKLDLTPYSVKPAAGGASASEKTFAAAVAKLKANPSMAPQFDAVYGKGKAKQYLGN